MVFPVAYGWTHELIPPLDSFSIMFDMLSHDHMYHFFHHISYLHSIPPP